MVGQTAIGIKEMEWEGVDWIDLAQDINKWRTLVVPVMNLQVPYNTGSFLSRRGTIRFSRTLLMELIISDMMTQALRHRVSTINIYYTSIIFRAMQQILGTKTQCEHTSS
jgi:hypothetical protein